MELNKNQKILAALGGILILQLIVLLLLNLFSFQRMKTSKLSRPLIKGIAEKNIKTISITDFMDTFSLEKKEDHWFVKVQENYIPGNVGKIKGYINKLLEIKKGMVVYKNSDPSNDKTFGFDQMNYQVLKLTTNNKKDLALTIGNPGSKRGTSYVKLNNENSIREVESSIAVDTDNDPTQWAEVKIFSGLSVEDVEFINVNSTDTWYNGEYTITYNEDAESDKDNYAITPAISGELENYALKNIIQNTVNLNTLAYKFDADMQKKNILATIQLTLFTGKEYKINIYKADNDDLGGYLATVDFNDYVFILSLESLKRIIKDPKELIKSN